MTDRKRRVEDLLDGMGRMVVPVADQSDAERQRMIEAVNQRLELTAAARAGQANVRRRWLTFAAAAAVLSLAALVVAEVHAAHSGEPARPALSASADLFKRGDAVRTGVGETRRGTLENGAQVQLAGNTELSVSALEPGKDELVLDRGRVDLTVPKLGAGHTLSVATPDALVTVRGTRFSVEVVPEGARVVTSVEVAQGSVWVRQGEARWVLEAGSRWSSRPAAPEPSAVPADAEEPLASSAPGSASGSAAARAAGAAARAGGAPATSATPAVTASQGNAESSTLAQENDLYAAASRAARAGNDALAVRTLNELLARYPNAPLAQNARVDRFRALNRAGRVSEAVALARRYLADYPNGFARDEAKALVLQSLARP